MTEPFEWDEAKRDRNLRDHGVDFIDVLPLFEGEVLESEDDRKDYGETRIRCLGEIGGRVHLIVYTRRGERRRLISARKANAKEQRAYYARDA
jgi:uncharacterized protein